jgi:DNA-binding MarR family transcriptional regulator
MIALRQLISLHSGKQSEAASMPGGTTAHTVSDHDLSVALRASRVFSALVAASVAHAGDVVTPPQLRALVLVATRPDVDGATIAAALDIHPSGATRLCDRLAAGGLLNRAPSATDRRRVILTLTTAGMRLVESVMDHRRAALERILAEMSPEDIQALTVALSAFSDAAEEPAALLTGESS